MLRIAIIGATGKMGRNLVTASMQEPKVKLTVAIVKKNSSLIDLDIGHICGIGTTNIITTSDFVSRVDDFDLLIDFSSVNATLEHLNLCCQHNKALVIGTTGFDDKQMKHIEQAASKIPLVFSANYSIGMNIVFKLLEQATKHLVNIADIEIYEAHHKHKLDAPSGTALSMGNIIATSQNKDLSTLAVFERSKEKKQRQDNEIGFASVRAGDIIGEHTAIFALMGERIELSHKAHDRGVFAIGALTAAIWLSQQTAGYYTMNHVLDLS